MLQVREQVLQMPLEQVGDLHHRLQSTATDAAEPILEEPPPPSLARILPELREQLLGGPGPRDLQIQVLEPLEFRRVLGAGVLRVVQPQLPRAGERFIPLGPQRFVFLTPQLVHRRVEVRARMVAVVHDGARSSWTYREAENDRTDRASAQPAGRLDSRRPARSSQAASGRA